MFAPMQQALMIGKILTALTWAWALAGTLGLDVPQGTFGPLVLLSLVVAHGVQLPMFMPKLEGNHLHHAAGILCFGVFYLMGKGALTDGAQGRSGKR